MPVTLHRDQRGFTLVELVIAITILGILAAVVTTALFGLTKRSAESGCAQELVTIQSAMDSMMTARGISSVAVPPDKTKDWDLYPTGPGTEPLYPNYLRQSLSQHLYTWTAAGEVSAATGPCK